MSMVQIILWAGTAIAFLQFSEARALDRRLPDRATLPMWGKYGPNMARRKVALFIFPWITVGMTIHLLVIFSFKETTTPAPIASKDFLIVGIFLAIGPVGQIDYLWRVRKWVAANEPELTPPKMFEFLSRPKLLFKHAAVCGALLMLIGRLT